jgi:hypothetical protein
MVFTEPGAPGSEARSKRCEQGLSRVELDGVALPVIEADSLDTLIALERPREASRGVLPA